MAYITPRRVTAFFTEANAIAPKRRRGSDGTLGDAAHREERSDHNPEDDPGGPVELIIHAADVSQSMPGTNYWQDGYDQFDVWGHCYRISREYVAADDATRRRRWPWLHPSGGGYMVWGDPHLGYDVIFNPSHDVHPYVRRNVGTGREHIDAPHAHFSIGHNAQSENDTQPVFTTEDDDMTPAELKPLLDALREQVKSDTKAVVAKLVPEILLGEAGKPGLIQQAVDQMLGGYPDGVHYKPAVLREALVSEARKPRGLSKRS